MEQGHWATLAVCLLLVLVIGVGGDPDGPGWLAGLGVGLLLVLAVLVWYVWDTRQLIESALNEPSPAPDSPEVAPPEPLKRVWDGSELYLWLRAVSREADREETTFRLYSAGESYALHALLHPMHADWSRRLPHQVFDPTVEDLTGTERWMRMASRGSFRAPLMPASVAVDLELSGPTGPGTVLCLRWDDPRSELRRWRCWQMANSRDQSGGEPRRELRLLGAPVAGGCDRCPERIGGVCPHVLARNAPEAHLAIAASLFGYEDWLEDAQS